MFRLFFPPRAAKDSNVSPNAVHTVTTNTLTDNPSTSLPNHRRMQDQQAQTQRDGDADSDEITPLRPQDLQGRLQSQQSLPYDDDDEEAPTNSGEKRGNNPDWLKNVFDSLLSSLRTHFPINPDHADQMSSVATPRHSNTEGRTPQTPNDNDTLISSLGMGTSPTHKGRDSRTGRSRAAKPAATTVQVQPPPSLVMANLDDDNASRLRSPEHDRMMDADSSTGVQELCVNLKHYPWRGLTRPDDPELVRRMEDFHRARFLRRKKYPNAKPWGVLGLFLFIDDMRLDLEWAQEAAWRRFNQYPFLSWQDFQKVHKRQYYPCIFMYVLELVATALFLYSFHLNGWNAESLQVNPMIGPSPQVLVDMGALFSTPILEEGEWYRLVAPLFLHAGLVHYALNMVVIHFVGGAIERFHGPIVTATVFLLSGVGGNILSVIFVPERVTVGPSGGLYGLIGLCASAVALNWDVITLKNYRDKWDPAHKGFPYRLALLVMLLEMVFRFMIGLTPYIDNFAHLGGFLYGMLFGVPLGTWIMGSPFFGYRHILRHARFWLCRAAFLIVGLTLMISSLWFLVRYYEVEREGEGNEMIFRTREPICPACRYLTCLPFPFWTSHPDEPWWYCDDCHQASATFRHVFNSGTGGVAATMLNITCPHSSEEVALRLLEPIVNETALRAALPSLCRQFCPSK